MNIEKRGTSYRVQPMRNGKRYSLTFDKKPTKAMIEEALANAIQQEKQSNGIEMTFEQASKNYTESKKNVLSPKTIKEYKETPNRLSKWFVDMKICDITQDHINRQVNELSLNRAPKTVRNYHGFISAVLRTYRPELNISTHLPQKVKNEPYIPFDEDIKQILSCSDGTMYEIPIKLMCYGMRRSEILALTPEDIAGDVVHINKAMVLDDNNEWVIKTTKTTSSTRDIIIPLDMANKIKEQGFVYNGHPNSITDYLNALQDQLKIPRFSAHKLRHYFASKMSALGIPDADIMALGGWETDNVMKTVYRHSLQKEEQKRDASAKLSASLFN